MYTQDKLSIDRRACIAADRSVADRCMYTQDELSIDRRACIAADVKIEDLSRSPPTLLKGIVSTSVPAPVRFGNQTRQRR